MSSSRAEHVRALFGLLVANAFWAVSFPLIKAVILAHETVQVDASHWFVTFMTVAPRFVIATAVLALILARSLSHVRRDEVVQGALMALFACGGMSLQNDGLHYTTASSSAFLSQIYSVVIPVVVAAHTRKAPTLRVGAACASVLSGVVILSHLDLSSMRLGRGEIETLIASGFFMIQVMLLSSRRYSANRALPVTIAMFATEAVVFTTGAFASAGRPADVLVPFTSGTWVGCTVVLTLLCTLGSFTLMNKCQPKITATEAGLVYCVEPVFTAVMALFLPGMLSRITSVSYANESVTWQLIVGGALVTLGNVIVQLDPPVVG